MKVQINFENGSIRVEKKITSYDENGNILGVQTKSCVVNPSSDRSVLIAEMGDETEANNLADWIWTQEIIDAYNASLPNEPNGDV